MTTWNAVILMGWTAVLHILHSAGVKAEIKKIGPMIARKLWEDRVMRMKSQAALKAVNTEVEKAANE